MAFGFVCYQLAGMTDPCIAAFLFALADHHPVGVQVWVCRLVRHLLFARFGQLHVCRQGCIIDCGVLWPCILITLNRCDPSTSKLEIYLKKHNETIASLVSKEVTTNEIESDNGIWSLCILETSEYMYIRAGPLNYFVRICFNFFGEYRKLLA